MRRNAFLLFLVALAFIAAIAPMKRAETASAWEGVTVVEAAASDHHHEPDIGPDFEHGHLGDDAHHVGVILSGMSIRKDRMPVARVESAEHSAVLPDIPCELDRPPRPRPAA